MIATMKIASETIAMILFFPFYFLKVTYVYILHKSEKAIYLKSYLTLCFPIVSCLPPSFSEGGFSHYIAHLLLPCKPPGTTKYFNLSFTVSLTASRAPPKFFADQIQFALTTN